MGMVNFNPHSRKGSDAAYLLITDDMLEDYAGYTQEKFCDCTGYPKDLITLRLK